MTQEPSKLEKVAGSLTVGTATTVAAAMVGGPIAAMLPLLANTLAAGRRRDRVNQALAELQKIIEEHAEEVKNLTDSQFRVVSEIVESTIQTSQNEKLEFLKQAARNVIQGTEVTTHESEWLARVIRDISADELQFAIENRHFESIVFSNEEAGLPTQRFVHDDDPALPAATGLIALGLLFPGQNTYRDIGTFRFNPLVDRLIGLVADDV